MNNSEPPLTVESLHSPQRVVISGFEAADSSLHMIEWMRQGPDFRKFVVRDLENELYSQDSAAQLLAVDCIATPAFETRLRPDASGQTGVVTKCQITFPISLRVQSGAGVIWRLRVDLVYHATNLDIPEQLQLTINFQVIGHQPEAQ